jgi:hypothetical protein
LYVSGKGRREGEEGEEVEGGSSERRRRESPNSHPPSVCQKKTPTDPKTDAGDPLDPGNSKSTANLVYDDDDSEVYDPFDYERNVNRVTRIPPKTARLIVMLGR